MFEWRLMVSRSSTASLRSDVYEKVEENGRTYHKYDFQSLILTVLIVAQVQRRE
jgi:hypothetical protein